MLRISVSLRASVPTCILCFHLSVSRIITGLVCIYEAKKKVQNANN